MEKVKKIGIIGHFGKDKNFTDGQTVKTKEIYKILKKHNYEISCYDTYKISRNPIKILYYAYLSLKKNDVILVILSNRGYGYFLPLLVFFNKIFNKRIFDFVVGGSRNQFLEKKKSLLNKQNKITKVYVETDNLLNEYVKLGINNVEKIINFKEIQIQKRMPYEKKEQLKVCTFSRICKEKGIEESIEAVKKANELLGKNKIELTIYGVPDVNYQARFNELKEMFPEYIKYGGLKKYDESTLVLKEYDLLLFQTFWQGEGMPGTIIDASFSGLPTIASDWNYNKDFIENDYNGKLVGVHNVDEVANLLVFYYNNQEALYKMKENCLNKAKEYQPEEAMKKFFKEIEE